MLARLVIFSEGLWVRENLVDRIAVGADQVRLIIDCEAHGDGCLKGAGSGAGHDAMEGTGRPTHAPGQAHAFLDQVRRRGPAETVATDLDGLAHWWLLVSRMRRGHV